MPRLLINVLVVQKGLAVRHHATAGRVSHPGAIDGKFGSRTSASLSSWFRNDTMARGIADTGVDMIPEADGYPRIVGIDLRARDAMHIAAGNYVSSRHLRPIGYRPPAPTPVPDPVVPEGSGDPWPYTPGSMDLDPEPEPPEPVVDVGPLPERQQPPPRSLPWPLPTGPLPTGSSPFPVLRPQQQAAPVWPWVVGGLVVLTVVGTVVWKSR